MKLENPFQYLLEAGVKIYGQITGNVNGKSLDGIDRTIIIKSVGQIISTIKPLNDENLKNTFSALIMLNGAPACFFTESAIPNIKNGNQLSKDAIFSSKTTVVFGDDPGMTPTKYYNKKIVNNQVNCTKRKTS